MDRKAFYDELRASTLFGGKAKGLSTENVLGLEALLDASVKWGVVSLWHVAYILANVYHETGTYMLPIKETVFKDHKDKNPSDATVIARLNKAFKAGQLTWVKTPYWADGWFGRGMLQLTHEDNYRKVGEAIGVDLVLDRDKALDPKVSADAAVVAMTRGLLTGKKLSSFTFPDDMSDIPSKNPRRIVNGSDGTDKDIAGYANVFYTALVKAGYDTKPADPTQIAPSPAAAAPTPARSKSVIVAEIRALLDELELFGG